MTTPVQIVNEAIQLMGDNQKPVTGTYPSFDGSAAGIAASYLYGPCVAAVGRQFEFDFGRATGALVVTGNTAPFPWAYEYTYPAAALEIWQVMPGSLTDTNNPLPTNWTVGNTLVAAVQTKVIWADLVSARAVYNNNPDPSIWDALFHQAVVRLLASEFAIALGGRPETSSVLLNSAGVFSGAAMTRDG